MSIEAVPVAGVVIGEAEVVTVTNDVWQCFLAADESSFLPVEHADLDEPHYVAAVSVSGGWTGQVVLELSVAASRRAAALMLAHDAAAEISEDEVADAVGELVNMVGGNLKGLVPDGSSLGLPVVLRGAAPGGTGRRGLVTTCEVSFSWLGDPVRVHVRESTGSGPEPVSR